MDKPRSASFRVPIERVNIPMFMEATAFPISIPMDLLYPWRWSTEEEEFLSSLSSQHEVVREHD